MPDGIGGLRHRAWRSHLGSFTNQITGSLDRTDGGQMEEDDNDDEDHDDVHRSRLQVSPHAAIDS